MYHQKENMVPNPPANTTCWPWHDAQVSFRGEIYDLYRRFGISGFDVNKYGPLSYMIRAGRVKDLYDEFVDVNQVAIGLIDRMKPFEWIGGCGPNRQASLDIRMAIPSENVQKNGKFYDVTVKTERPFDIFGNPFGTEYFIVGILASAGVVHDCESNGFHGLIQRFTPCKHRTALQRILQERSAKWCNDMPEGFYHGLSVGKVYATEEGLPLHVFDQVPDEIVEVYDKCTKGMKKGDIHSIDREAAILHAAAKWKYWSGLLTHTQLGLIEPILEANGDA